jgi:hypothetical protein
MPFLTSDHGRHELTPGIHILGGHDEQSVPLGVLRQMPAVASITVLAPAAPVIRRLAPDLVRINGRHLGKRARLMRDGMRIEIGPVVLTYSTVAPPSEAATVLAAGVNAAEAPARLVDVKTGRTYELHRDARGGGRPTVGDDVPRHAARVLHWPGQGQ